MRGIAIALPQPAGRHATAGDRTGSVAWFAGGDSMSCSKCGTNNPPTNNFCAKCGNALVKHCEKCQAENPPTSDFCGKCGAPLTNSGDAASVTSSSPGLSSGLHVAPEQNSANAGAPDGERKTVTALFADIKGSTELLRDLDPEEARAIIDPALKLMIDVVHRYDGYVVQSTGDGIFALFGAPVAHEDHPQRALHAALATRDELRRRGEELRMRGRAGVEVRIGINTGEVVMRMVQTGGHTEYSPVGHVINLASRMQTAAPAGGVVVSEATRRLVEGYFELRGLGPTEVRGVGEDIEVYEVVGVGALHGHFDLAARRGLTLFVGREAELTQMRQALELAIGGGGQIVAAMAEAGTGKSRLFHEFKATIPAMCKVLEAYSVSHGKASAWLPVLELLRGYFGVEDGDDAAARREKVAAVLRALDPALEDTLPYLFGLLGIVEGPDPLAQMAPPIKLQRTLDAIKRMVLSESFKQPVVVIFEDLHWIDAQTQALLDVLADNIASARVLLLVNYRPEYRDEWNSKSHYSQLSLNPLSGADGTAMLAALLGEGVELNPLKRLIGERTGGNPFFIEEIVQALFDEGALVRNGVVKVARSLSQLRLPLTVQGILAARIDRQPGDHKRLLQTLSVIGRESPLGLLRQVSSVADNQLGRMLAELQSAEFIYEQPSTGGVEYVFKHALTQEVAYNSLLIERRKQLHEQAGQTLETIFASQLDDHLGQLAHHYSLSDNLDKAVEYLGRAGQQAMQRSANTDAVSSLTAAIDFLQKLPDSTERIQRELPLQMALGQANIPLKNWSAPEVERPYARARELCEQLGDLPQLLPVLFGLWSVYHVRGQFGRAREAGQDLLRRAEHANDPALLLMAHNALGETLVHRGEFLAARRHLENALALYDPKRDRQLVITTGADLREGSLSYLGWALWHLGYPDLAVSKGDEGIAAGRAVEHPNSIAAGGFFANVVRLFRREAKIALENAENLIAFCEQHDLGGWPLFLRHHRGLALSWLGRVEEGVAEMEQANAILKMVGAEIGFSNLLYNLADGYREAGRYDDALRTLEDALLAAETQEEHQFDGAIYQLRGELLLNKNPSNAPQAERCFEQAIMTSCHQSSKSLELRGTTSLARLLDRQGRRDEARAMLADIYNWFTEGFDTADLIDAKALLDELSR
jgi:class 3 adenylate cyclase/tetratricopeptide (TPR) repeat protein